MSEFMPINVYLICIVEDDFSIHYHDRRGVFMFSPEINRTVTDAFRRIIEQKGSETLKKSRNIPSIMSDFLPGNEYESIRKLIKIACEENAYAFLLDESIPKENRVEYASRKMTENVYIPIDISREVISWGAKALNLYASVASSDSHPKNTVIRYSTGLSFAKLDDGTCEVIDIGNCTDKEISIPPTSPEGRKVIGIGKRAFWQNQDISSISFPNGIEYVGGGAFYNCSKLSSVTFASPSRVRIIHDYAFSGCIQLIHITLPEGITTIGVRAFDDCVKLSSVLVPSSVQSIGNYTFSGCTRLASIIVEKSNPKYYSQNNCIIEKGTERLVVGINTSYIPEQIKAIGRGAFSCCSRLPSVKIPTSVKSIEDEAFWGCAALSSLYIPSSVEYIAPSAFCSCSGLLSLIVDEKNPKYFSSGNCIIQKENYQLVLGCKTSSIPYGVRTIGRDSFYGCEDLATIDFPRSVETIKMKAFAYCKNLNSITIPISVKIIEYHAFYGCRSLHIYCEHIDQPKEWESHWHDDRCSVTWKDHSASSASDRSAITPPPTSYLDEMVEEVTKRIIENLGMSYDTPKNGSKK